MNNWEIAILKCINSLGSGAELQEIYRELDKFIELTSEHLKPTEWGRRPAYQHQVRSHISNLRQAGYLIKIATGRYSLTAKGRNRIGL